MEFIEEIKPKTLPEDKFAFLLRDQIILDFGGTTVIKLCDTRYASPACISIKNLYGLEPDPNGIDLKHIPKFDIPVSGWVSVPINIIDSAVFNSVASAGDSQYWSGKIFLNRGSFNINVVGLLYFLKYSMSKVEETDLSFSLDWNGFYYLYKLFKDVTAKKLGILNIFVDGHNVWLSNENKSFYIIVHQMLPGVLATVMEEVAIAVRKETYGSVMTCSRKALMDSATPLEKHLTKPFKGDNIECSDSLRFRKYKDAFFSLYMSKQKV